MNKKEFIKFEKIKNRKRWIILNEKEDDALGEIYYNSGWHKFVAEFNTYSYFDDSCLQRITDFVKKLNLKEKV